MKKLALLGAVAVVIACGDDRYYANLLVRTKVVRQGAPVSGATVKLTTTANDGAREGAESVPFTLKAPILQPCTEDLFSKCPRGDVKTDRDGVGSLLLEAPSPRKDYEDDEKFPERERHPGRYAKELKIEVGDAGVTYAFQKDDPLWQFHSSTTPEDVQACTFDSDYRRCTIDVTVNVP